MRVSESFKVNFAFDSLGTFLVLLKLLLVQILFDNVLDIPKVGFDNLHNVSVLDRSQLVIVEIGRSDFEFGWDDSQFLAKSLESIVGLQVHEFIILEVAGFGLHFLILDHDLVAF